MDLWTNRPMDIIDTMDKIDQWTMDKRIQDVQKCPLISHKGWKYNSLHCFHTIDIFSPINNYLIVKSHSH